MFLRFLHLCTELGLLNAILWSLNRLFGKLGLPCKIFPYYLVAQPVSKTTFLPAKRGVFLDVRILQPGDPALADLPIDAPVLRYRFDQNAICFGAFKDGSVVGCLWLCLDDYDEDEVRCHYRLDPAKSTAWDFDVYVAPSARGGFAFLKLWDAANAYLNEREITWSLSRISAFKPNSLSAHQHLGARRFASAVFLRLGPLQLMISSVRPWIHLSFSSSQVPSLGLSVSSLHGSELTVNPPLILGQL